MTKIIENHGENSDEGKELPRSSPNQTNHEGQTPRSIAQRSEAPRQRFHFGMPQSKLAVYRQEEGYHYHWINDLPGRLELAEASGYQFVLREDVQLQPGVTPRNSDSGSKVSQIVGRGEDGQPLRAYLMRIPQEMYEESQAFVQAQLDKTENAIRRGRTTGQEDGSFYQPAEKIKLQSKLG